MSGLVSHCPHPGYCVDDSIDRLSRFVSDLCYQGLSKLLCILKVKVAEGRGEDIVIKQRDCNPNPSLSGAMFRRPLEANSFNELWCNRENCNSKVQTELSSASSHVIIM